MTEAQPTYLTADGRLVTLGPPLGRGGEATVFTVAEDPGLAAKIYRQAAPESERKLAAMAKLTNPRLLRYTAWPLQALYTEAGLPAGFLMPRIEGALPIHLLYGPKSRQIHFPEATYAFLTHVAANVARSLAVVHDAGHVVGDVNHNNILVTPAGTVCLIDCDSFQIAAQGETYPCHVGVSTHLPPELQGQSLRDRLRTANHDRFGLAVLVFQMLFCGRHPFAGRPLSSEEVSIERAIQAFRFVYSLKRPDRGMQKPPYSLDLTCFPPALAEAFEQAFSPQGVAERPSAVRWVKLLEQLAQELLRCRQKPHHWYPPLASSCPWCGWEAEGVFFFLAPQSRPGTAWLTRDVETIWSEVRQLGPPPLELPSQALRGPALPQAAPRFPWPLAMAGGVLSALASFLLPWGWALLACWAMGMLWQLGRAWRRSRRRRQLEIQLREAEAQYAELVQTWQRGLAELERLKQRAAELYRLWTAIEQQKERLIARAHQRGRQLQLQRHLQQFAIADAHLEGIGPSRKETLRSFGIETAADVTRDAIRQVPGFGPHLTQVLVAWRNALEQGFSFRVDPAVLRRAVESAPEWSSLVQRQLQLGQQLSAIRKAARQQVARLNRLRADLEPKARALMASIAEWRKQLDGREGGRPARS